MGWDWATFACSGLKFLWENISKCYFYAQIYRLHRNTLNERVTTLAAKVTDVDQRVSEASRRGEDIKEEVMDWKVRADRLIAEHEAFNQNVGQETSFFSYSYCCWRCKRIEQVEELTSRIQDILAEPPFESVSLPALSIPFRTKRQILDDRAKTLAARKADVGRRVAEAVQRDEVIKEEVKEWMERADRLNQGINAFNDNDGEATGCFSLRERIEIVEGLTYKIQEILAEPCFESVSDPRPLPPPRFQRSTTIENFENGITVAAVNKVREALWNDEVSIVGLFGTGGVGKTTLMKQVAAQVMEEKLYNHVVFATISKSPNLKNIQNQIAESFSLVLREYHTIEMRARQIADRIKREKKVLIVLDDLWEELTLNEVGVPSGIELKSCESKIVLTTRNEHVCKRMRCHEKIKLDTWKTLESRDFFKRTAGTEFNSEEFKSIADSVADECKGLPLALVAVAKALGDKDEEEWRKALIRLQQSMFPNDDDNGIVKERIKLSYDYLKAKEQRCFLTCCLFPEDHNIEMEDVAMYVFGLGLFPEANTVDEARGNTQTILKKLVASGLLLTGDEKEEVKMHDVIRDVAIQITSIEDEESSSRQSILEEGKQVFMVQTGNHTLREWPLRESYRSYTAISFMSNDIRTLPDGPICPQLHTLLLQYNYNLNEIPSNFFKYMNALRVLDLSLNIACFTSSIALLTTLQTLHLNGCKFTDVDALGELQQLKILSLKESDIVEFPQNIGNLTRLRMLDLTSCSKITIWQNVLAGLTNLEELYMRGSFKNWQNKIDEETSGNAAFEEVINLPRLIILKVDILNAKCFPRNVRAVPKWIKFEIFVCADHTRQADIFFRNQNRANSKTLFLDTPMTNFPDWFIKAASEKTEKLTYRNCRELNLVKEYGRRAQSLAGLKFLVVEECPDLKELFVFENLEEGRYFGRLAEMRLVKLDKLKSILKGPAGFADFTNLKLVSVIRCSELTNLFSVSITEGLSNLEDLWVEECFEMKSIINNEEGITLQSVKLPKLKTLCLANLPILNSFYHGNNILECPSLEYLHVQECPMFQTSAPDFNSLCQIKENDEQHMNILRKRMKEPAC